MPLLISLILAAYLFGSIPTAYILAKALRGVDLRSFGSGSVTSSNAGVLLGKWASVVSGVTDVLKGAAPVWVAQALDVGLGGQLAVGLAAVAGHNWSIYLKFEGGRGLAPVMGILLAAAPWLLVLFATFSLLGVILFRNIPLIMGIATALLPLWAYSLDDEPPYIWATAIMAVLVVAKRLLGNRLGDLPRDSVAQILLYRLLYDRDTREREPWIYRNREGGPPGQVDKPSPAD